MEFYLSFPPRRSILRRNTSVHCAVSSSPWVHLLTKKQQHLAFNRAAECATVKTQPRIEYILAVLPFIGASTFELIVGLVRRQRKENAMAWNFCWSVFPSKSFATLGSIAFRITARLARCRNRKTFDQKYLRREKTLLPSCLKGKFFTNQDVRSGMGLLFYWQSLSHALWSLKYQPIRMRCSRKLENFVTTTNRKQLNVARLKQKQINIYWMKIKDDAGFSCDEIKSWTK